MKKGLASRVRNATKLIVGAVGIILGAVCRGEKSEIERELKRLMVAYQVLRYLNPTEQGDVVQVPDEIRGYSDEHEFTWLSCEQLEQLLSSRVRQGH